MDKLVSTISSPVALSVCAARLGAGAQLEGVVWHHELPVRRTHTCVERAPLKCSVVTLKSRAAARSPAYLHTFIRTPYKSSHAEFICGMNSLVPF